MHLSTLFTTIFLTLSISAAPASLEARQGGFVSGITGGVIGAGGSGVPGSAGSGGGNFVSDILCSLLRVSCAASTIGRPSGLLGFGGGASILGGGGVTSVPNPPESILGGNAVVGGVL